MEHMTVYALGSGQHITLLLQPDTALKYRKVQLWFEIIHIMAIGLTKYSVLLFYRRLFPSKSVLRILQVVASVVLAWQIAIIAGYVWECRPVQGRNGPRDLHRPEKAVARKCHPQHSHRHRHHHYPFTSDLEVAFTAFPEVPFARGIPNGCSVNDSPDTLTT